MLNILEQNEQYLPPKKRLTARNYELMPTNGKVLQLIDGDFFMTPAPFLKHQEVSRNLEEQFLVYLSNNPIGKILDAPVDYHIDNFNVVQPDLVYISKERYSILFDKGLNDAPDIVIEILSPSTEKTDREVKKDLYWKVGVKEYWIVDINNDCIKLYTYKPESYELIKIFHKRDDDILKSKFLSDFEIDLKQIFYYDWLE